MQLANNTYNVCTEQILSHYMFVSVYMHVSITHIAQKTSEAQFREGLNNFLIKLICEKLQLFLNPSFTRTQDTFLVNQKQENATEMTC